MKRPLLRLVCALGVIAGAFASDGSPTGISIGQFRTGMSFAQARAAAPTLEWKEQTGTLDSKIQKVLRAAEAMQLGGSPYEVQLKPGWHGAYELLLIRKETVRDAKACTKVFAGMLADLEGRFGAFAASNHQYEDDILMTQGKPTRTATRGAGKSSNYTWHSTVRFTESSAVLHLPAGELSALGQYFVNSMLFGESVCHTVFKIAIAGRPPEFEEISAAALEPVLTPSIAVLHDSLERVTIPRDGLMASARCKISRTSGSVGTCTVDPALPKEVAHAVTMRSAHMAFATDALDPGNKVPLFGTLSFRLDPTQRLAAAKPVDVLDGNALQWTDERAAIPIRSIITSSLSKREYDSATAKVTCQIQADGSLLCVQFDVSIEEGSDASKGARALFEYLARDELSRRRAPPKLSSGEPSSGKWVSLDLPLESPRINRSRP